MIIFIRNLPFHLFAICFLLVIWVLTLPINCWQLYKRMTK